MLRIAFALSAAVIAAWALIIATWPEDDAQAAIGYIWFTLYAIAALLAIWTVFLLLRRRARKRH